MKATSLPAAILLVALVALSAPAQTTSADSYAIDAPWTIPDRPTALTRTQVEAGWQAAWEDFLAPAPSSVPDGLATAIAAAFSRGTYLVPADYARLLARVPPPAELTPPWCAAAALLADFANDDASAVRYAEAAAASSASEIAPGDWRTPLAAVLGLDRLDRNLSASAAAKKTALRRQAAALAPAILAAAPSSGISGRFILKLLDTSQANLTSPDSPNGPLVAALDAASVSNNPVASMLRASVAVTRAWDIRGSSWGVDVGPAASAAFREQLSRAASCAAEAARLAPDWPEPYGVLITTSGAAHIPNGVPILKFFNAAVTRQIDWITAYNSLFNFLKPRWSGSATATLNALRAVLSLDRFDIRTPFEAVGLFDNVVSDQADMPDAYARAGIRFPIVLHPKLWPHLRHAFEGYLAAPTSPVPTTAVLDSYLPHAARARQPADAIAALDRASYAPTFDTRFYHNEDEVACGPGGLPALRALAALQHLAPTALADAERAFYLRNPDALASARDALLAAEPSLATPIPEPARSRLFDRLSRDLLILRDWEPEPDWQDLYPGSSFVSRSDGRWADLANGALRGWSYDSRGGLFAVQRVGNANEAAADFILHTAPDDAADPNVALVLRAGSRHYVALVVNAATGNAECIASAPGNTASETLASTPLDPAPRFANLRTLPKGKTGYPSTKPAPDASTAPHVVRLRLRCIGGRATGWVDGRPVFEDLPVPQMPSGEPATFAAGVFTAQAGYLIDIERLRHRYLRAIP